MLVALAGELAPLAKKLQRPSSTEATVTIARIGLPIMRPSDTEQRHENVVCARVLSDGVNRPSWRLQPRPARLPLVTTRTTKHPALIPHEIPAGARQSPRHDPQSRELDVSPTLATEDKHACGRSGGSRSLRD